MMQIGALQYYHDPLTQGINDLQALSKAHEIISKAKTELWHWLLTHYFLLYFLEVERYRRSSPSAWLLNFLEILPTPHIIKAFDKDTFIDQAWDVVGKKVSKTQLLSDIYEIACASAGLPVDPASESIKTLQQILAHGRYLIEQRNKLEASAKAMLADNPDYQRLCSVPGIGPIHALTILTEAGDLRRFRHHR